MRTALAGACSLRPGPRAAGFARRIRSPRPRRPAKAQVTGNGAAEAGRAGRGALASPSRPVGVSGGPRPGARQRRRAGGWGRGRGRGVGAPCAPPLALGPLGRRSRERRAGAARGGRASGTRPPPRSRARRASGAGWERAGARALPPAGDVPARVPGSGRREAGGHLLRRVPAAGGGAAGSTRGEQPPAACAGTGRRDVGWPRRAGAGAGAGAGGAGVRAGAARAGATS